MINDATTAMAKKYPKKTALISLNRTMIYRELDDLCDRFAASLSSLNVKKGDRLALLLPNLPQFLICYFGAMRAGAIVVPCNPFYKERELELQLKDSGAETIVTLDTSLSLVLSLRERTKLHNIITTSVSDDFQNAFNPRKDERERRDTSRSHDATSLLSLLEEEKGHILSVKLPKERRYAHGRGHRHGRTNLARGSGGALTR
jgi:long-chain acyl-CoA synthetase